mgnify:CR=1 FL=1
MGWYYGFKLHLVINHKGEIVAAKVTPAKRFIIETVNDQLKIICQLEHSRHRSLHGLLLTVLGALIAYSHKKNKPSVTVEELMA